MKAKQKPISLKESQYRNVLKYMIKQADKYPDMSEDEREYFIMQGLCGICAKWRKGYDVAQTCIGVKIYRNKLREVIQSGIDLTMIRRLIDVIDHTGERLVYSRKIKKNKEDEEE